jgi:alginate O-acetyltransferase complex protein AlgI
VLFRTETFAQATSVLASMAGLSTGVDPNQKFARYWNSELMWSIVFGIIFSMPAWSWLKTFLGCVQGSVPAAFQPVTQNLGLALELLLVVALLLISGSWLAGGTYNPFIYFRF